MTKINDFKAQLAKAKLIQGSNQANPNLKDHVGEILLVTGMHITENIKVGTLSINKVSYSLTSGITLDSFYLSATESARDMIDAIGEGPYPLPLEMQVMEVETNRGPRQYCLLLGLSDPDNKLALLEMEEIE